jgi:hypothetical protein
MFAVIAGVRSLGLSQHQERWNENHRRKRRYHDGGSPPVCLSERARYAQAEHDSNRNRHHQSRERAGAPFGGRQVTGPTCGGRPADRFSHTHTEP